MIWGRITNAKPSSTPISGVCFSSAQLSPATQSGDLEFRQKFGRSLDGVAGRFSAGLRNTVQPGGYGA